MFKLNLVVATTFATLFFISGVEANAAAVPCEDVLKQLRDAEKAASMSDADKAQVADLEAKGIERCNADDDKRADEFFDKALKIVTKK